MTHDPIEELLGAYALHAVDDDEREAVEAHLAICPRCRAEVDAHREVAAQLALGGAPAPDGVWERIAGVLDGEEEAPPLRLVLEDGSLRSPRSARAFRPAWQRMGMALTAVAAAFAIVALSVSSIRQQDELDRVEQAQGLEDAALSAFGSPDARLADLTTPDGVALVRAAVLPDGTGYLFAENLPDLDDRIYQLWGATADHVVSLGPLGSAPTVLSFAADGAISELMITSEAEPVEQSSQPALVRGVLS